MSTTSLRLSDQAIRGLVDPRTGERLDPIGLRRDGSPIFPIMGGAPDDEGGEGEEDTDPAGGSGGEGDPADADPDEEGDEEDEDDPDKADPTRDSEARIKSLEDKNARLFKRRKEAEARANDLQKELDELKAKGGPEAQALVTENADLKKQVDTLKGNLKEARMDAAFLKQNKHEWENPVTALKLADLSEVELDDDGTVHGLDDALDAVAKEHPYLLKKKRKTTTPPASGKPPKDKKDSKETEQEKAERLRKKYKIGR